MYQDNTMALSGEKALELYLQGKEVWNRWVEENPDASIDFSGINFSKYQGDSQLSADFSDFHFPGGVVDFSNTIFGNHLVSFTRAIFNSVYVRFNNANFGNGGVNFYFARFSKTNMRVEFDSARFGRGNINFDEASFYCNTVSFKGISSKKGNLSFFGTTFNTSFLNFESMTVDGEFRFLHIKGIDKIQEISFKYSSFKRSFDISNNKFNCVIDLTQTAMSNHCNLEGVICVPKELANHRFLRKTCNKDNIARFRRLKELAEVNKDHDRALDFHAYEMRSKRGHENITKSGLFLDVTFDWLSNYGRSELRPFLALIAAWLLFAVLYFISSPETVIGLNGHWQKLTEALSFSGGQIMPIIPGSRLARNEGVEILFKGDLSPLLHLATFLQSIISLLMLFLIGLALRNRFRI